MAKVQLLWLHKVNGRSTEDLMKDLEQAKDSSAHSLLYSFHLPCRQPWKRKSKPNPPRKRKAKAEINLLPCGSFSSFSVTPKASLIRHLDGIIHECLKQTSGCRTLIDFRSPGPTLLPAPNRQDNLSVSHRFLYPLH